MPASDWPGSGALGRANPEFRKCPRLGDEVEARVALHVRRRNSLKSDESAFGLWRDEEPSAKLIRSSRAGSPRGADVASSVGGPTDDAGHKQANSSLRFTAVAKMCPYPLDEIPCNYRTVWIS